MKRILSFLVCGLLLALATGCAPTNISPTLPTSTLDPEFLQSTPFTGPITLETLKNAEFQTQNGMKLVKLVNGTYQAGLGTDFLSVSMLDPYAIGDLNADGMEDAAVVLAENYGGTGQFEYLVPVFYISGGAISPSSGFFLGDRVKVNSMSITGGTITLDMLAHAPNDGLCCPSLPMTQSFRFYLGPGLTLVHATSGTGSAYREIKIDQPIPGNEITRQVHLTGSITIAPFENTLKVRILDSNYVPIYDGPIMVTASDMGAPGTFDVIVDLTASPTTSGMIHIEIMDVSMADGSTIALDSVDVTLK